MENSVQFRKQPKFQARFERFLLAHLGKEPPPQIYQSPGLGILSIITPVRGFIHKKQLKDVNV